MRDPTKESLHELGLDYVSQDFIQRGILSDSEPDSEPDNIGTSLKENTSEKEKK